MSELVFLLEEPSARAMLEGLLPRLLPDGLPIRFIVFEGKKEGGSRAIGPHLDLENKRSRSFEVFVTGIKALITKSA